MLQDAEVMPLHAEAAPLYAEVMLLHAKPMQDKEKAATKIRNCFFFQGGANGIRTSDTRIFSPMLYQLSYGTIADLRVQRYELFLIPPNFCCIFFVLV